MKAVGRHAWLSSIDQSKTQHSPSELAWQGTGNPMVPPLLQVHLITASNYAAGDLSLAGLPTCLECKPTLVIDCNEDAENLYDPSYLREMAEQVRAFYLWCVKYKE